jgi:glucose/arabinose dehydrogenase
MNIRRFSFIQGLALLLILAACAPQIPIQTTAAITIEPSITPNAVQTATATLEPTIASVTTLPDPAGYTWAVVKNGFQRPVDLANAADGSGRLFVLEQRGVIRVMLNDEILATPFLDIQDRVGSQGNEQGLLGIAFHPNFKTNGIFFVDYTNLNGDTVISRFHADVTMQAASQSADPASEQILLQIAQPYPNHNGGQILFGPDGMLWIGMGDGGSAGDPLGNGQSLDTLLGKILRIDVDHGSPYAIPADNPFAAGGGLPEIWAYGLRNPWGLRFDLLTGDLYIADVGQDRWEEIDFLPANFSAAPANFGWNLLEGDHPYKDSGQTTPANYVAPVFEYGHDQGCSVTGGAVYRGTKLAEFYGVYLFGDYCSGTIWGLIHTAGQEWKAEKLFQTSAKISAFGSDEQGELYFLDLTGVFYRLEAK